MDSSAVAEDLHEVSVLLSVAHRMLLGVRDDIDTEPNLAAVVDELNTAHEQLDLVMDGVGRALDTIDNETDGPREQRPAIH